MPTGAAAPDPLDSLGSYLAGPDAFKPFGAYFPDASFPDQRDPLPNSATKESESVADWLANLHSAAERNEKALRSLDEEIRQHPDRAESFYKRGCLLAQLARSGEKEKLDGAMADLSRAVALKPDSVEARHWRGYVAAQRQEWKAAVADFSWVIEHHPETVVALAERAETWMRQGEYDRAIADFDLAEGRLKQSPEGLWSRRAWCYAAKGQHHRAIADYTRAIENATISETWVYMGRAQSYRATDEIERALADLDCALRFKPDDAAVHFLRADILLEKGDYDGAAEEADRLTAILPNHAGPYFLGSVAAWLAGIEEDRDLTDAAWAATLAERIFPCAPAPRLIREVTAAGIGQGRKEALEAMDKCLALEPRLSFAYALRAWLNASEGRFLPTCRDLALFVARFHRRNYHFFAHIDWQNHRFTIGFQEHIPGPQATGGPKPVVADVGGQCMERGLQQLLASAFDSGR